MLYLSTIHCQLTYIFCIQVHGEYRVQLPDGRVQVVKYTADHKNGFVPIITYEGPQTAQAANIHYQPPKPTKIW